MEFMSKSGVVCEDERRKNVRKPRSKCVEDVFSAEVLSKRCSVVFYVHPTGSPHSQMQDFKRGMNGDLQNLFPTGKLLMSSCRKKVTTRQRSLPFASLRNPAFAGTPSGLSKPRKQRSAFSKTFQSVCGGD